MKSIEQLLQLSKNPYYKFSEAEQESLNAFLSRKSEQKKSQKSSSDNSEKNIPATVINKNVVTKETGNIPTINNVVDEKTSESQAVEEAVHPDAVK